MLPRGVFPLFPSGRDLHRSVIRNTAELEQVEGKPLHELEEVLQVGADSAGFKISFLALVFLVLGVSLLHFA